MNRRFLVIMSSLLAGTILSAQANPFKDIEGLDNFLPIAKDFKSIPSPRTFQAEASRTAAGVLHYAPDKDEGPVILLGLRDDEETYCNLGGKSDEEEGKTDKVQEKNDNISATLAQTASREVEEESNGYYAHHPYDLESQPFIDTLTKREKKGSLLYRMYWKKVQKVDSDILFKALEEAQEGHNKEYKSFLWVPVSKILASLKREKSKIKLGKGQKIELFGPLFKTLSTDSGLAFLESILSEGKISRFNSKLRPLQNRLYFISNEGDEPTDSNSSSDEKEKSDPLPSKKGELEHADFKVHWELPDDKNATRETYELILNPGEEKVKKITAYKVPLVPLGQNAWGDEKQTLRLDELLKSFEVPLSAEKDQKDFAYAITAHGAAMVELKHKANEIQRRARIEEDKEESSLPAVTEEWNPNCDLSLSRIHLRIVLGKDFKTAEDFHDADNPQRAADIANLRTYLTTYNEVEYAQKDVESELKKQINFTDNDLEVFADYLEWEGQLKDPSFCHASTADMNNLWQSFTYLHELFLLSPLLGKKIVTRGTHTYFRNIKTMGDILKSYGSGDYENGRASLVLCANYVLTAGQKTSRTSSSSIEYFLNNHSIAAPEVEEKFAEATALAGISRGHYPYFRSPFLQFLAHRHPTFKNSVIVGLSVPPQLVPIHIYASTCGGSPFTKVNSEGESINPAVSEILKGIQDEYETHKEMPESFEERKEEKRDLIPEARISLHPDLAFNKDVHMKAFNRFPLSKSEQAQFESEMRTATIGTLADWLASHFKVMPDSFAEYPALKRLYHFAYKAITGEEAEEKFAFESFRHLVANGHVNGVKEFVKAFPEVVDHEDFNTLTLAQSALRANNPELLKYLFEELFKQSPQELFGTSVEIYKAIRTCLAQQAAGSLDYLFSSCDLKEIPTSLVQIWCSYFDDCNFPELAVTVLKHFPQHQHLIIRSIFKRGYAFSWFWDKLIAGGINLQLIIEEYIVALRGKKSAILSEDLVYMIGKHRVDLTSPHSQTNEPLSVELLQSKILEPLLEYISLEELDPLITSGLGPELLVEEVISAHRNKKSNHNSYLLLQMLDNHKVDLTRPHSQTNESLGAEILRSKILRAAFEEGISEEQLDRFITYGMSPYSLFEEMTATQQSKRRNTYVILNMLAKYKVDLSVSQPKTGSPLIFDVIHLNPIGWTQEFRKYFYDQLPSLLNLTDASGKTIFGYAQMAFERKTKNELLYLVNPYTLWTGCKTFSQDSWNWYYQLSMVAFKKNHEEVRHLMQEIPAYLDESHAALKALFENENDFEELVKKLRQKIKEQKEVLNATREALKRHDFQTFYHLFESSKEMIREGIKYTEIETFQEHSEPSFSPLRESLDENESESLTQVSKEEKEKEVVRVPSQELRQFLDWINTLIPVTETVDEKDLEEIIKISDIIKSGQYDVEELKSRLPSLKNPKLLRYILTQILRIGDHDLTLETLKQAYPDMDEFIALEQTYEGCGEFTQRHPLSTAIWGNLQGSVSAIIEYVDDRFPDLAITQGVGNFAILLEVLLEKDVRTLVKKFPYLFTHQDNEKDFFRQSIESLPFNVRKEFVFKHKDKLKEIQIRDGTPYFFSLFDEEGNENEPLIIELVKNDHSFLEIKSVDGLTFEDFLGEVMGHKNKAVFNKMMKKLKS
jgi:hypothetical protein